MTASELVVGTYTGTGAAQTITLGFKPKAVVIFNYTDGDQMVLHLSNFTAASSIGIAAAVGAVSNAVTLTATGFSVGTDTSVSESAKVFNYIAIGNEQLTYAGA